MDFIRRDVEKELLSKPREYWRPDRSAPIYCAPYSKDFMDFDNWEFMFQTKYHLRNGLTMHRFETPPKMVLDFACGGGLWTIEAAKQWKVKMYNVPLVLGLQIYWQESKIVGFDFLDENMPKKCTLEDVAQQIEWVQGNLYV